MMKKQLMKSIIMIALMAFTVTACSGKKTADANVLLGKINSKEIKTDDFKKIMVDQFGFKENKKINNRALKSIFRNYYNSYVFLKEGEAAKFFQNADAQKRIQRREKSLVQRHIDVQLWQKEIKPRIKIGDAAYAPYAKQLKVSHILVMTRKRKEADAKKILAEVQKELKAGKKFADVAKKYSDDPGSKMKGGNLGWISQSTPFVPEFKKAAFEAKKGQVTKPVKSAYGYHLILVTDKKEMSVDELKKDKKITQKLQREVAKAIAISYMKELRKKYASKVHYYPERLKDVKKNAKKDFLKVDGATTMTVGDMAQLLGARVQHYIKKPNDLKNIIDRKLVEPNLRYLEGVAKGYNKSAGMDKQKKYQLTIFKGRMYENHIRLEYRKQEQSKLADKEVKSFYEANKNRFMERKTKKVIPFEKAKHWVSQTLLRQKAQGYMANMKAKLYKKYKIEIQG